MDIITKPVNIFDANRPAVVRLLKSLNSRWKMWFFFLTKLPSGWFWGLRVRSVTPQKGVVTIPYGWRTQNPFRSIYFAAQSGAAELSTGLLAVIAIHDRGRISMLITNVEAEFTKKASSLVTFTCEEGGKIQEAVQKAIDTGEGQQVKVTSVGTLADGTEVSRISFTWSFKVKQ